MKRSRLKRKGIVKKRIVRRLPKDASYQGVNYKGQPLYFSRKTGKTYASLEGYGTPLFGRPKAGNKFMVI